VDQTGEKTQKRILTGARPSGLPHLGNYFGAFRPLIDLQSQYERFFFLADFHALNAVVSPKELREHSHTLLASLLAAGLDPHKGMVYAQSAVPEVNELAWILGCLAPYGMLARAHSFKDAQAKGLEINMGVFNYPILMAADILLFDADIVPVGQDQKQHLEMARDLAQRFNFRYGELLVVPEPMISDSVAVVPGTDGEKMSKSKDNLISMFATDKQWKSQVMGVVTGSATLEEPKDPLTCNVYKLYSLMATPEETNEMAENYRRGNYGYGHAKLALLAKVIETFSPMRDRYFDLMKRPQDLEDIMRQGSKKARHLASLKLEKIQSAVGLLGRPF
jgi:tryptophanyl-tRNA synthetase